MKKIATLVAIPALMFLGACSSATDALPQGEETKAEITWSIIDPSEQENLCEEIKTSGVESVYANLVSEPAPLTEKDAKALVEVMQENCNV